LLCGARSGRKEPAVGGQRPVGTDRPGIWLQLGLLCRIEGFINLDAELAEEFSGNRKSP
jgi:hypothetical protein